MAKGNRKRIDYSHPELFREDLDERLKRLTERGGLTWEELAKRAGVEGDRVTGVRAAKRERECTEEGR